MPLDRSTTTKRPIVRSEHLDVDSLTSQELDELATRLWPLYTGYFEGLSEVQLRELVLERGPGTKLLLMYGPEGELASFGIYRLERIEVAGRTRLVFNPGTYSRPGYVGVGERLFRHGLRSAARAKLRAPRMPLDCLIQMANAPAYRSVASRLACVYPDPELPTPPEVIERVRALVRSRGLETVGDDPFVIRNPFPVVQPYRERLRRSGSLRGDPHASLFWRLCVEPNHILATYFPLTSANLVASAVGPLRSTYRRQLLRVG